MAFRLIPKEERFFEDFVEMAEQIHRGAGLLEQMARAAGFTRFETLDLGHPVNAFYVVRP